MVLRLSLTLLAALLALADEPSAPPTVAPAPASAASAASPATPAPLRAEEVNAAAKNAVYRLDTMVGGAKAERLHGTAFVVDPNGLLLTNFHVVREALLHEEHNKLNLEVGGQPFPATVRAVDVVNDLAIVHVEKAFPSALTIAAGNTPSDGEVVYSFGFPATGQLTFVQGNYGGEKPVGFIMAGFASLALNHGMSGGPLLNGRAEVVGVNRALVRDAQTLSFFSPLSAVREMIGRGRQPASISTNWKGEAVGAIKRQEEAALAKTEEGQREQIGGYSFTLPLPNQNCAQTRSGETNPERGVEWLQCRSGSLTPLVGESNAFEVRTFATASAGLLSSLSGAFTNSPLQVEYVHERKDIAAGAKPVPGQKAEHCHVHSVKNTQGVDLSVSYCALANQVYPGLFSTFVRIELGSGAHRVSFGQVYQGLSPATTAELLGRFLESIHPGGSS